MPQRSSHVRRCVIVPLRLTQSLSKLVGPTAIQRSFSRSSINTPLPDWTDFPSSSASFSVPSLRANYRFNVRHPITAMRLGSKLHYMEQATSVIFLCSNNSGPNYIFYDCFLLIFLKHVNSHVRTKNVDQYEEIHSQRVMKSFNAISYEIDGPLQPMAFQ